MTKFPDPPPPEGLFAIAPHWKRVSSGTEFWRIYFRGGDHPTAWNTFRSFGPLTARFDHHLPPPRSQPRAILYAATSVVTCLAEVFQAARNIDTHYREPWLVGFAIARDLRLLDLTGPWPTRAGASMAINVGQRPRARRWSRAIYEAYPDAEGLWYASSMHANQPAVVLYERAREALPVAPFFHRALSDPLLLTPLQHAARSIGYALSARPIA